RDRLDASGAVALRHAADEPADVCSRGERTLTATAQDDRTDVAAEVLERAPQRVDDPCVDGVDRWVVEPDGLDHAGILENSSRSSVFLNLPTLVLGISSTNSKRSGSHHFAKSGARNSRSSAAVAVAPSRSTTAASGRSSHFASGTATTAASATAGCAISAFSSSTDEIHSPPDLMTSFERSLIWMYPFGWSETTSPVLNQPSSVQRSAWSGVSK